MVLLSADRIPVLKETSTMYRPENRRISPMETFRQEALFCFIGTAQPIPSGPAIRLPRPIYTTKELHPGDGASFTKFFTHSSHILYPSPPSLMPPKLLPITRTSRVSETSDFEFHLNH